MSAGNRLHGVRSLIYVGGTELSDANAWSVNAARDIADASAFGETWKKQLGGLLGASGNINAWLAVDQKILYSAATKANQASETVMIYPNRNDITDVISFSAFFGVDMGGDINGAQTNNGAFTVDGAVTLTGFS